VNKWSLRPFYVVLCGMIGMLVGPWLANLVIWEARSLNLIDNTRSDGYIILTCLITFACTAAGIWTSILSLYYKD
jgi:hypothetical protein